MIETILGEGEGGKRGEGGGGGGMSRANDWNMSPAGHESGMKYNHNSGSRRPFETLTSAFYSIFQN